jgi:ubiquinone/menaquinone biosynthesis C-methylase UbiE
MTSPSNIKQTVRRLVQGKMDLQIELGCGNRKRHATAVCIDLIPNECVDIVGDIVEVLTYFPDNCVSAVYAYHCLEHIKDIPSLMTILARIMKAHGQLRVVVPHFSNPYYYSDPTHVTSFGLYTFSYLAKDLLMTRKVPNYLPTYQFDLCRIKLVFKSPRPYYFRYGIKKIFQALFNLNHYFMEFYEENLCYLIPCYEIVYVLKRNENPASEPL